MCRGSMSSQPLRVRVLEVKIESEAIRLKWRVHRRQHHCKMRQISDDTIRVEKISTGALATHVTACRFRPQLGYFLRAG